MSRLRMIMAEREPVLSGAIPFPGHRPAPLPAREPPARRFWAAFASSRALASPPSQRALGRPTTREPHKPDEACSAHYHQAPVR
ncbi:unnamed protein product [Rangifer tarandus platyrhynchus]|uniref:Uncharacterized protein n=2 Tax=Rangifer tarandus platyrhynchus TaxID=3082113 RepID=A0ABN8Z5X8_RANTA|nr:unnamed protein product [Rangifer tarandus platyrhynchus]CAI9703848.1 unnamed protein product [Rangifer tarandus platyrhynchus]